jgi:hypothetical protein
MNLLLAIAIVVVCTAVAVSLMLFVRRRAPDGSYFNDGDRAAGVFGMLATGFSVLLGFVVFLAFESFDQSRTGAETEARIVAQQNETAQLMPLTVRARLSGELACYARYVVGVEWPKMEDGSEGDALNAWGPPLFRTLQATVPKTASEQAAYSKWLDQTSDREQARADRVHGAEGVIPWPLWAVLFLSGGLIFVFMLFFADSGEPALVQAVQIGTVAAVITAMLLLIGFLDTPFHRGAGGVRPVAMERTVALLDQEARILGQTQPPPCNALGLT